MMQIQVLAVTLLALLRIKVKEITAKPERGAGGNTLEILLLAIGGVVIAGIVVAAVATSVNSRTDQLNP